MKSRTGLCAQRHKSVSLSVGAGSRLAPSTVPHEVNDAISVAADAYADLETSGRHLHFTDFADGTVGAVLEDLYGNPLDTLSIRQVLRLAGGGSAS
jgi:hypothetical protein